MKHKSLVAVKLLFLACSYVALSSCTDFVSGLTKKIVDKTTGEVTNFNYGDSESLGPVVTKELSLAPFTKIDADGRVQIVVRQDSACGVSVTSNEKCLDKYTVAVDDNELEVKLNPFSNKVSKKTPRITLYVSMPSISGVELSGAGNIEFVGNFVNDTPLDLDLSGVGNIIVDTISSPSFSADISGASSFRAGNITTVGNVEIEISGAGDVVADVQCERLKAKINGAGSLTLTGKCSKKVIDATSQAVDVDTSGLVVTGTLQ